MRVKGTIIMDYVRMVRANKDKQWDKYFEPEDREIINGRILPSNWYSYEFFQRIGLGVFKEIGGSDLETSRTYGRFTIKNMLEVYGQVVAPGDPVAGVEKWTKLRQALIDADFDVEVVESGPDWIKYGIKMADLEKKFEIFQAFCYTIAGYLEEIVEQAGAKNASTDLDVGKQGCRIMVKWQ